MIGTDLNERVCKGNKRDEEMMGRYGIKKRNEERQKIQDFTKIEVANLNICFVKKNEELREINKSVEKSSQTDYIVCR